MKLRYHCKCSVYSGWKKFIFLPDVKNVLEYSEDGKVWFPVNVEAWSTKYL